jgi:hypothetical protein
MVNPVTHCMLTPASNAFTLASQRRRRPLARTRPRLCGAGAGATRAQLPRYLALGANYGRGVAGMRGLAGLGGTAWCHLVVLVAATDATVPRYDGAATPPPPACNSSAETDTDVAATCADFCAGKCSFRNASSGAPADQGVAVNLTLYRLTPVGVLGIANRNTGDPPGDVGFFLSRKTLAAECAKDPSNIRCFLNGINLYGKFEVEVDGSFGPCEQLALRPACVGKA